MENNAVDKAIAEVLQESHARVERLLEERRKEVRLLAKALYEYDYLDEGEIIQVLRGEPLTKQKVRER